MSGTVYQCVFDIHYSIALNDVCSLFELEHVVIQYIYRQSLLSKHLHKSLTAHRSLVSRSILEA